MYKPVSSLKQQFFTSSREVCKDNSESILPLTVEIQKIVIEYLGCVELTTLQSIKLLDALPFVAFDFKKIGPIDLKTLNEKLKKLQGSFIAFICDVSLFEKEIRELSFYFASIEIIDERSKKIASNHERKKTTDTFKFTMRGMSNLVISTQHQIGSTFFQNFLDLQLLDISKTRILGQDFVKIVCLFPILSELILGPAQFIFNNLSEFSHVESHLLDKVTRVTLLLDENVAEYFPQENLKINEFDLLFLKKFTRVQVLSLKIYGEQMSKYRVIFPENLSSILILKIFINNIKTKIGSVLHSKVFPNLQQLQLSDSNGYTREDLKNSTCFLKGSFTFLKGFSQLSSIHLCLTSFSLEDLECFQEITCLNYLKIETCEKENLISALEKSRVSFPAMCRVEIEELVII